MDRLLVRSAMKSILVRTYFATRLPSIIPTRIVLKCWYPNCTSRIKEMKLWCVGSAIGVPPSFRNGYWILFALLHASSLRDTSSLLAHLRETIYSVYGHSRLGRSTAPFLIALGTICVLVKRPGRETWDEWQGGVSLFSFWCIYRRGRTAEVSTKYGWKVSPATKL